MSELSTLRIYLLRAMYLLMTVGLGLTIWPGILAPGNVSHMGSVVRGLLGALALMALWGFRYPVNMLPILLFELMWKVLWVVAFGLGPWLDGGLDPARQETFISCLMGVVLLPVVIPWGYVFRHYIRAAGDRSSGTATGLQQAASVDASASQPLG